jgi:hypothetical protein
MQWAKIGADVVPYADTADVFGHRLLSRKVPRRGYTLMVWNCSCGAKNERASRAATTVEQMTDHIRWVLGGLS